MRRQQAFLGMLLVCAVSALYGAYFLYTHQTVSNTEEVLDKTHYSELRSSWKKAIQTHGGQEAYAQFKESVDSVSIDEHTQAHIFGEALYKVEGLEGISVCDQSMRFGCYHSFFGQAIHEHGIDILPELDAACRANYGDTDTKCQHGLGHGVLVYTGYDELVGALELCRSISSDPTGGCSGGVFMEYNYHTMEEVEEGTYMRVLGENKFEPCDTLPEEFHQSCYLEQVQLWAATFNYDFTYIGTLCQTLARETGAFDSCFRGIGNHLADTVAFDTEAIITGCNNMSSTDAIELCFEGASWLLIGVEEYDTHKDLYVTLCSLLVGVAQQRCYERQR